MSEPTNSAPVSGTHESGCSDSGPILHQFRLALTKKQAAELKSIWREYGQNDGMILMQPVLHAGPFDLQNCFAMSFVLNSSARAKVFAAVDAAENPNRAIVLNPSVIEALFARTNFGGAEKTDVGRRGLMCECVLKRASGYHDGHTITTICKDAGLLNHKGNPTNGAVRWAFDQLYHVGGGWTILERLHNLTDGRQPTKEKINA